MKDLEFIAAALREDVGAGDYSTLAAIASDAKGKAVLLLKEPGVLAGMEVAKNIFEYLEPEAVFTPLKKDGDRMEIGDRAFEVEAKIHTILTGERLVLNCMQRMSGIATLTATYVKLLEGYKTKILDTRKTTPLFRQMEKDAVLIGGGSNHRMGLYDMIMLKDNHIDFCGGIAAAIAKTKEYLAANNLDLPIEVETRKIADVRQVLKEGGVHRIMFDNFDADAVGRAVMLIDGRYETEASGGINKDTIQSYAAAGVDFISVGALIHQAVSLDMSLKAQVS